MQWIKCSSPKSARILLCKLCACKHSSKPAYTVLAIRTYTHPLMPAHTLQAVYMHTPTQAPAYSASCVHASPRSSLRILCKLCTCIYLLKPRILCKLCTCMMHVHSGCLSEWMHDASTHSSIRILCKLCTFRPRMQICMQVCMRALHAKFAGRDMHAHAENACRVLHAL